MVLRSVINVMEQEQKNLGSTNDFLKGWGYNVEGIKRMTLIRIYCISVL